MAQGNKKARAEKEIEFIKSTMETSTTYENVPPLSYLAGGVLGVIGTILTYLVIGVERVENLAEIYPSEGMVLLGIWGAVFVTALAVAIELFSSNAKKKGLPAWNSLAKRMFLSQIPLIAVAGLMTLGLALKNAFELVPALWLGGFGVITYSFSYYTKGHHKIQGVLFMTLCALAIFSPSNGFLFMGLGFGGVLFVFGIIKQLNPAR